MKRVQLDPVSKFTQASLRHSLLVFFELRFTQLVSLSLDTRLECSLHLGFLLFELAVLEHKPFTLIQFSRNSFHKRGEVLFHFEFHFLSFDFRKVWHSHIPRDAKVRVRTLVLREERGLRHVVVETPLIFRSFDQLPRVVRIQPKISR